MRTRPAPRVRSRPVSTSGVAARRSPLALALDSVTAAAAAFAIFRSLAPDVTLRSLAHALRGGGYAPPDPGAVDDFEIREPGRGRSARTPAQIPMRGWVDIGWRVLRGFNGDRLMFVAGGVTFFTLLAIFPAIAAFVSLYGLFADAGTAANALALLSGVMPPGVVKFVADQMTFVASHTHATLSFTFAMSLLLSLWTANASMKSLIYGLNIAYHETEKRNLILYNLQTLGFTLGGLAFVLFSSALVVAVPIIAGWFGWAWDGIGVRLLRWPVLFLGYIAMLSVLYRYGPCRQHARWSWLTWGGTIAAVLSLIVSWLFSTFLGSAARYDRTYGPLGALMGFMIWSWWSIIVVLIGAEINAEMEHQTARDTTTGASEPMGQRGALVADTLGPRRGEPGAPDYTLDGAMELSRRYLRRWGSRRG